jgi:hypothetical protein
MPLATVPLTTTLSRPKHSGENAAASASGAVFVSTKRTTFLFLQCGSWRQKEETKSGQKQLSQGDPRVDD